MKITEQAVMAAVKGYNKSNGIVFREQMRDALTAAAPFLQGEPPADRSCTCHPDDTPPIPCTGKYALSECRSAERAQALEEAAKLLEREAGELDGLVDSVSHHLRSKAKTIRALAAKPAPDHVDAGKVEGDGLRSAAISNLIEAAKEEAAKAMRKFPQPNYVISKIAEEAGEVVKAAIHCAEGRENPEAVIAEIKQTFAMLFRLLLEGDEVHGLSPLLPPAPSQEVAGS